MTESYYPVFEDEALASRLSLPESEWLEFTDGVKGMLVTKPGMSPAAIRVDQIDREQDKRKQGIMT